jgi:tetratricopeptide (TPR) repeat protein
MGDYQRAEEFLQKAIEIESRFYCRAIYWYSKVKLVQGKFQESYQFNSLNCPNLECPNCLVQLFESSLLQSEFEQAEQYYKQWQTTTYSPDPWLDRLDIQYNYQIGYVYHHLGRIEEADKIFIEQIQKLESELENGQRSLWGSLPNYLLIHLSRIHAFQGNKNEAIKYLTEYAEQGFYGGWHDFILIDPFFESLRDDPEFKAIVKQAQEEKAALRAQIREMEERGELTL